MAVISTAIIIAPSCRRCRYMDDAMGRRERRRLDEGDDDNNSRGTTTLRHDEHNALKHASSDMSSAAPASHQRVLAMKSSPSAV